MKMLKIGGLAAALVLTAPAATAQELDTSQLRQSADYERNRILVRSTLRQKERYDAQRGAGASGSRARAKATCQNKGMAARKHGANHPKVRELYRLCAAAGF